MDVGVEDLAAMLSADILSGSAAGRITGFASLTEAVAGDLAFFTGERHQAQLSLTKASVVLVSRSSTDLPAGACYLAVDNPSEAFERVTERFGWQPLPFAAGIHPTAVVGACIDTRTDRIKVGPNAVIEDGVTIGDGSEIGAGCFVGRGAVIGEDCRLHPNSTLHEACVLGDRVILHSSAVVGADGFGYVSGKDGHRKIRQSGSVQIDSDVEIGAGTTVDRARFGRTWIGAGTKIDNQVQIAHNVVIGRHCIIVSGTGIAGSARLGDYVVLAAQVGVADHVSIGSGCTVAGRSGVTKDLAAHSGVYMGFPAVAARVERKRIALSRRLPSLEKRLRELERRGTPLPLAMESEAGV